MNSEILFGALFGVKRISPLTAGGNTQGLMLFVDDVYAHCAHARAKGATIIDEPKLHDHGDDYWAEPGPRSNTGGTVRSNAARRDWLDEVELFWSNQLQAFKAHAERKTDKGESAPGSVRTVKTKARRRV
jgi:hypothetical protein